MELHMRLNNSNSPIVRSENVLINKFRVNDIFTMLYRQNKQIHKHDIKLLVPIYYDICMKCLYKYLIDQHILELDLIQHIELLLSDNYDSNDFDIIFHQALIHNFDKLYYKNDIRLDFDDIKRNIHNFYLPATFLNPVDGYFKNINQDLLVKNELGIARYIIDYNILAINNGLRYNKFIKLIEIVFDMLEKYTTKYITNINLLNYDINFGDNMNISIDYKPNITLCMILYRIVSNNCIDRQTFTTKLNNLLSGIDKIKSPADERIVNEISELKTIEGRFKKYILSEFKYDFTAVRRLKIRINELTTEILHLTIPEWNILIKSFSYLVDYRILCLKIVSFGFLIDSIIEDYTTDTQINIQYDHSKQHKSIAYLSNISDQRLMEFLIEYYKMSICLLNILELIEKQFTNDIYLYRFVNFDKIVQTFFVKDRLFYNFDLSVHYHNINVWNNEHNIHSSFRKCLKFLNISKYIRNPDQQSLINRLKSYIKRYSKELSSMFIEIYGSNLSENDNIEKYSQLVKNYRKFYKYHSKYRERGIIEYPYIRLNNERQTTELPTLFRLLLAFLDYI